MEKLGATTVDNGETQSPEVAIGMVAPYGTPLTYFTTTLSRMLTSKCGYSTELLRLSEYTKLFDGLSEPYPPSNATEAARVAALMTRGDQARELAGSADVLALCAIKDIHDRRSEEGAILPKRAFVLRQLKRPEEVYTLREVYGDGFHLVGLYCPRDERERHLTLQYGMSQTEIDTLIGRDEEEPSKLGQHVRDTFHLSDVFFRINADGGGIDEALERWINLLFGLAIHSPTFEEFGMFQAHGAAHRSAQLSRQVGASILTERGDVIAVGANEVPRAGGGQYWEGDPRDNRDHKRGVDSNDEIKREILLEALATIVEGWNNLNVSQQTSLFEQTRTGLKGSRLLSLTEFVRAVHAEMDAILSASRNGVSVRRATLYCTTFPCHNCAKHIVSAGIKTVVYVEPYPKSLSSRLHNDSISLDRREANKVMFAPFVGIAPRRYADLFSMRTSTGIVLQRKDDDGKLIENRVPELRLRMPHFSMFEQESKRRVTSVRLGPLTESLLRAARWYQMDSFPAVQVWADDVEAVLTFLEAQGRLDAFFRDVKNVQIPKHRDARLAEARGAFHLSRNGFRIVGWEPAGEGRHVGEVLVALPNSADVFVEVKQPSWEGELRPRTVVERNGLSPENRQRILARKFQGKYINGEGGAVGSHLSAMDVVRRNALPKLTDRIPNLVIVVDDLKVTPVGLPSLSAYVKGQFTKPDHDPDDADDKFTYERLGGVLFLQPEANNDEAIDYRVDFVENPGALPACALPVEVRECLSTMRDESRAQRAKMFEGRRSIFDILGRNEQKAVPKEDEAAISTAIDLRKREPVVCPDCGQQLFAVLSKDNPGKATLGDCGCGREIVDIPDSSIMFGLKDGAMFIYGPDKD